MNNNLENYEHYMLKEIDEQPNVLERTLRGRINSELQISFDEIKLTKQQLQAINRIYIVACGTAYHAGLVAKYAIEQLVRITVEVELASEFRYRDPIIDDKTLIIVISQSGETADTLAAANIAKANKAHVIAITNVADSKIARAADDVILTVAGPEIAIPSTKAYTAQILTIYLLALYIANARSSIVLDLSQTLSQALLSIPSQVATVIDQKTHIRNVAKSIMDCNNAFYLGYGMDYTVALEGALKLKEASYIHADAYAAGEFRHGTIALIEAGIPVIGLFTQPNMYDKMISIISEVKERGAKVIAITNEGINGIDSIADELINIPITNPLLSPLLSVISLQLLSYYTSILRGIDVDKPRNLTKAVIIE